MREYRKPKWVKKMPAPKYKRIHKMPSAKRYIAGTLGVALTMALIYNAIANIFGN